VLTSVARFELRYEQPKRTPLAIGQLWRAFDRWWWFYTDEFRAQREVLPLIDFPNPERFYESTALWPLFVSRIPAPVNRRPEHKALTDEVSLLVHYGERCIQNPWLLRPC